MIVGELFGVKSFWINSMSSVEKSSLSCRISCKIADVVLTQLEHLTDDKLIYFRGSLF